MRSATLLLLLPLAACGESAPPPGDAQSREMIRETIKAYHEAGDDKNVDKMCKYLDPDVSMFKGQEDFVRGLEACRKELDVRVKEFAGQSRATLLGRESIAITGDVAVTTYVASVGTQRAPITAVFRRSQGKWLIIHLHESWPPLPTKPQEPPPKDKKD
jgi:ketosteroid isomerase-like protein